MEGPGRMCCTTHGSSAGGPPLNLYVGPHDSSSFVIALRECARPRLTANIVNCASAAARARTAVRLITRLPAPQSLSPALAAARCAFTPRAGAPLVGAVAASGRRYINSSPCLRHQRSGRTLLGPHRCECRRGAYITGLRPNLAFDTDVPWAALRAGPRPAGQLVR